MTRKEFIKMCGLLGVGLPLQATFSSCSDDDITPNSLEKVIIIGAGAAGLSAAYLLNQRGIDFQILEASPNYGGRMKRTTGFADFPIPLGAEWLHVGTGVFEEIVNDPSVQVNMTTTPYDPNVDYGLFEGQQITIDEVGFTNDRKFINSTWFDFFDQYIVPAIEAQIVYDTVVESIDYSGEKILVKTSNQELSADKVIVTVPLKILQNGGISFLPELPGDKLDAINNATVWDGCKAFIEFSEKFYPAFTAFETVPETAGQKLYYDASYGQNSAQQIMGLFAVGVEAQPYIQRTGDDLINYMLDELDAIFDNKASANYVKHIFQNWNAEPHINGAYLFDHEDWTRVRTLGNSVDDKLYFAGEAYTSGTDWGGVHAAARSAKRAVEELVG